MILKSNNSKNLSLPIQPFACSNPGGCSPKGPNPLYDKTFFPSSSTVRLPDQFVFINNNQSAGDCNCRDINNRCSYILWTYNGDLNTKMHTYRRVLTYSLTPTPLPHLQRHALEHAKRARSARGASRWPRHGAAMPTAPAPTRLPSLTSCFGRTTPHRCCNGHG